MNYNRTGDRRAFEDMQTALPPGKGDLLPEWKLESSRAQSKALFLQDAHVKGMAAALKDDDDDGTPFQRIRKRKTKAEKAAAKAAAAALKAAGKVGDG